MKTISIIIGKAGQVAMQTHGFDGQTCKDATKVFEQGLGIVLADRPTFDQPIQNASAEVSQ